MKSRILRPRLLPLAALCAATLVGAAQAGEVVIYKQPYFAGGALTLKETANNLAAANFHDQASSIVVKSGKWEFCSQPNFRGDCVTLDRGEYPTLQQKLNHRVESVREVTRVADVDRSKDRVIVEREDRFADGRYPRFEERDRYASRRGGVELFAGPAMHGRGARIYRDVDTLEDTGLDRRVSSLVIHEGRWQVCSQPGYGGRCQVLEPGRYEDLGRFDNRIASLRRVG